MACLKVLSSFADSDHGQARILDAQRTRSASRLDHATQQAMAVRAKHGLFSNLHPPCRRPGCPPLALLLEWRQPQNASGRCDEEARERRQETADMDTFTFDSVARLFGSGMTRRDARRGLMAGAVAVSAGGAILAVEETAAAKNKRRKSRNKNKKNNRPAPQPDPAPEVNVCAGKNWCIDRTQTCGPAGGYGKCLVDGSGANICAELLFQVQSCTECEAPNCTNCRCVPAAGSADKCNNGANGYDFVCVREV
jgi:hypothetical protein